MTNSENTAGVLDDRHHPISQRNDPGDAHDELQWQLQPPLGKETYRKEIPFAIFVGITSWNRKSVENVEWKWHDEQYLEKAVETYTERNGQTIEPINFKIPMGVFSSSFGGICGTPGQKPQQGQRWQSSSSSSSSSLRTSSWEFRASGFRSITVSASSIPLSRPLRRALRGHVTWLSTWLEDSLRLILDVFRQVRFCLSTRCFDFEWLMCSAVGSRIQ